MAAGFFVRNLLIGLSLFVAVGAKGLMIDDFSTGEDGQWDYEFVQSGSMVGGFRYVHADQMARVYQGRFMLGPFWIHSNHTRISYGLGPLPAGAPLNLDLHNTPVLRIRARVAQSTTSVVEPLHLFTSSGFLMDGSSWSVTRTVQVNKEWRDFDFPIPLDVLGSQVKSMTFSKVGLILHGNKDDVLEFDSIQAVDEASSFTATSLGFLAFASARQRRRNRDHRVD